MVNINIKEIKIHDIVKDNNNPAYFINLFIESNFAEISKKDQLEIYHKLYNKWYRNQNPEYFKEKVKKYREENFEALSEYNKKYMKKYYQKNPDKFKQSAMKFRENNKEAYLNYQKEFRKKKKSTHDK